MCHVASPRHEHSPAKRSRELAKEAVYSRADVVPYWSDVFERKPGRVWQVPVEVTLARVNGAGIATAHRDHDVSGLHLIGGEPLGNLARDVDAELGHGLDDGRVELVGGLRSSRGNAHSPGGFARFSFGTARS